MSGRAFVSMVGAVCLVWMLSVAPSTGAGGDKPPPLRPNGAPSTGAGGDKAPPLRPDAGEQVALLEAGAKAPRLQPGGTGAASASTAGADEGRIVTALYYPWYGMDTWADPALSDRPREPYDGSDPVAIARHARWARESAIDVLVAGWFGPSAGNVTETTFAALLEAASAAGIHVAVLVETDAAAFLPSLDAQRSAIRHALDVHARHPAYFRYGGKPVLFFWRPRGIWTGASQADRDGPIAVAAWRALRDELDPDRTSLWIAETEHAPYLEVFDGMFPYSIAWAPNPAAQLSAFASAARGVSARLGEPRLWVATAMPGYDDTGIGDGPHRFAVDRADGAYYRRTFAAAVATRPDWINISSFNEWVEGHQIEPSVTYGDLYLELTRELVSTWKGSPN